MRTVTSLPKGFHALSPKLEEVLGSNCIMLQFPVGASGRFAKSSMKSEHQRKTANLGAEFNDEPRTKWTLVVANVWNALSAAVSIELKTVSER